MAVAQAMLPNLDANGWEHAEQMASNA